MPKDPEAAILETSHPSEGVYRVTYTPLRATYTVFSCLANFCDGLLGCPTQHFGDIILETPPDLARLQPVVADPLRLAVGERRNLPVLTWGYLDDTPSHLHADYTVESADPAVAAIEGHEVTGVAPGTTTVTFASGLAPTSTITVEVVDAPLGPPGEGAHPVLDVPDYNNWKYDASHVHRLALDSAGVPVVVARHDPGILYVGLGYYPAIVAEWTGTGFEGQFVARPKETANVPHLTLDERDRRYVLYNAIGYTWRHFALAERAADGGPDDWTYRDLPTRPWLDRSTERELVRIDGSWSPEFTTSFLAMTPRAGGGVWAAYLVNGFELAGLAPSNDAIPCQLTLRLLEVTDDAVQAWDVARWVTFEHFGVCDHDIGSIFLGPPQPGDTFPTIIVHGGICEGESCNNMSPGTFALFAQGTEYEGYELTPPPYPKRAYDNRFFFEDGQWKTELFRVDPEDPEASRDRAHYPRDTGGGEVEWFFYGASGFAVGDNRWHGFWTVGPLLRYPPEGGGFWDDPSPRLAPSDSGYGQTWTHVHRNWELVGFDNDNRHLDQLVIYMTKLYFTRATPAVPATRDSDDTAGRLVSDMEEPQLFVGPPLRTPGGATLVMLQRVITDNVGYYDPYFEHWLGAGLLSRQASPTEAFSPVPDVGAGFHLAAAGSRVFSATGGGLQVSDDDGLTFSPVAGVSGFVRGLAAVGPAVFLTNYTTTPQPAPHLWFSPDAGVTPYTDLLDGLGATGIPVNQALFPGTDDVLLILMPYERQLRFLRFDAAGQLVGDETLTFENFYPDRQLRGTRLFSGVALYQNATNGMLAWQPGATGLAPLAPWPANFRMDKPIGGGCPALQLPSGRLVAGGRLLEDPDRARAALITSDDGGLTWSAPRLVRPDGGQGQHVVGLALDGEDLLITLWDNASMRAWLHDDTEYYAFLPRYDQVFLRVPNIDP